jgi:hypothetical protein
MISPYNEYGYVLRGAMIDRIIAFRTRVSISNNFNEEIALHHLHLASVHQHSRWIIKLDSTTVF